jgi:hypothetical protein
MIFWKRLFGNHSQSTAQANPKLEKAAMSSRGFSERDNIGTRYDTQERVENFWTPYYLNRPKFPFIFYDMREKKDAMDAMLSLPPIKIASDSGKLISTQILEFGIYPQVVKGQITSWGFFLAGNQISLELYDTAITSCKKFNGTNPRVSDPPKDSVTIISNSPKTNSTAVIFDFEEKVDMLAQMKARGIEIEIARVGEPRTKFAIKRHYKAPTKETALEFLKSNPVDKQFFYFIIHTPEGVFGRDKDGIFEQPE